MPWAVVAMSLSGRSPRRSIFRPITTSTSSASANATTWTATSRRTVPSTSASGAALTRTTPGSTSQARSR